MNVYQYEALNKVEDNKHATYVGAVVFVVLILGICAACLYIRIPEISFQGVDLGNGEAFEGNITFN